MTNSRAQNIVQVANKQGGVVRRDQAIDAGFTRHKIAQRVATGEWRLLPHGGYQLLEMPGSTNRARAAASVLPNAVVSHFSAAAVLGISRVPTSTASVSVHSRTTHVFPGVEVFRNRDLAPMHITSRDGVPVTTVERTIVDLAAKVRPKRLAWIVDELLAERRVSVDGVRDVLDAIACKGKPGVTSLRSVLDERSQGSVNLSVLERAGLDLLDESNISGFVLEYPIPWAKRRRFDVAFPREKVAIEWDSFRWHSQKDAFLSDRDRDRLALEHGWRVLRFTWQHVHETPNSVLESIRTVLNT